MVNISEILSTVIRSLPPVNIGGTDFEIQYFEGVIDDVKEQINAYKKANTAPYPCVWLIRDFPEIEQKQRFELNSLNIIMLIDTRGDYQTPERLEQRINPYLIPIKNQVITGLKRAGVFVKNNTFTKLTFLGNPNAGIQSPQQKGRLFADYLDGCKLLVNLSYPTNLKLECYEFRH